MKHNEANVALSVSKFLQLQYKNIVYRFDIADGKLTKPQAIRMKALQGGQKGFCDLVIYEPGNGFNGLMIELKNGYSDVYKKDGSYKKSPHLERQVEMHKKMRARGFKVVFGLGLYDTIQKINEYFAPVGKDKINEKQGSLI